ncbi:transcription antitermination factor NusB [Arachnia propionica]|uniref:Transcription antitermination protein NusB n=1 Tax=Arachnia propionica TaxID=1750 RepID=A0A3P1TCK8_9ACTN|nr:transcription antitermination factor NusB [Arachnia propionica]RRD07192.1 transcription antitermination factor NusB [Arachnia propionica]
MAESGRHGPRTEARRGALDILFSAELRGRGIVETFIEVRDVAGVTIRDLTATLVHGIAEHGEQIDRRIAESLDSSWTLDRMPAVDRNIARIAVFELDHTDTPTPVVIAEAVKLASDLSTDDSPGFLNGLLSKAANTRPHI